MPEHLGDDLGVDALCQEERGAGMPEVVEPCVGQSGTPEERLPRLVVQVVAPVGVPRIVQNTRPCSVQEPLDAARANSWRSRCRSSASTAEAVSLMERRLPLVLGSVRRGPPFASVSVQGDVLVVGAGENSGPAVAG